MPSDSKLRPEASVSRSDGNSSPTGSPQRGERRAVVMKFGGSSVKSRESIAKIAQFVAQRAAQQAVVVVVSAMGKSTNELVQEAKTFHPNPPPRELDMLLSTGERHCMALMAMAIEARGQSAISLTGSQCGIITDHRHNAARVVEVRPFRILDELHRGAVVVVGGFQGVSYKREVTTLGRGGSDTTAVVLAAALDADCEIYSDVDGVYSSDPRHVDNAKHLAELDYDEMIALSQAGAKVLHASAVEYARDHDVVIYARATHDPQGQQSIIRRRANTRLAPIAVVCDTPVARLHAEFCHPIPAPKIPKLALALTQAKLRDTAIVGRSLSGFLSLSSRDDIPAVEATLGKVFEEIQEQSPEAEDDPLELDHLDMRGDLAQVSCIGAGLMGQAATLQQLLELAREEDIAIEAFFADEQSMRFFVASHLAPRWTQILHERVLAPA